MTAELIDIECVICGRRDHSLLYERRFDYAYDLISCNGCRLVSTSPKLSDRQLQMQYNAPVHAQDPLPQGDLRKANKRIKQFDSKLKRAVLFKKGYFKTDKKGLPDALLGSLLKPFMLKNVPDWRGEGKILDVGCNNGLFLYILKNLGWQTYGLELNKEGAKAAQSLGVQCFSGTLEEAAYPDNFFDIVRIYHVLEHVPQPREVLGEIKRILKPNGLVYFEVPNQASFAFYAFKHIWHGRGSHLQAFSPASFKVLCEKVGLNIVTMQTHASAGKLCSDLIMWAKKKGGAACALDSRVVSGKIFKSILIVPLCALVNLFNKGDRLAAVLQK